MPPFKDIIGNKYGRLTVIKLDHIEEKARKFYYYLCKCDCGKEHVVLKSSLLNGSTQSCGCLNKEKIREQGIRTATHHMTDTRLHKMWEKMKGRCYCKTTPCYKNYGGRGITVCEEWKNDFKVFYDWAIQNGYDENAPYGACTLDRINGDGNYEPSNCRWVSMKVQNRNRRNNHLITYNNETRCLFEWAEIYNIPPKILSQRINRDKKTFPEAIKNYKK